MQRPPAREHHLIFTLDPRKFSEKKQERLHIGDAQSFTPLILFHNQSSPVGSPRIEYQYKKLAHPTYPPDTKAFLYYFTPSEKPRIAGELRLRVAQSDDHASFERGSDLLKINGQLWSRSLYSVSKYHIPLYEKLREDGLVSDGLDAVLSTLPRTVCRAQHLYTLDGTFIVDFSKRNVKCIVITEQSIERVLLSTPFEECRIIRRLPYTGAHTNHYLD